MFQRIYIILILSMLVILSSCSKDTVDSQDETYTVSGVINVNGKPIFQANVFIEGRQNCKAESDESGGFLIKNVPKGIQILGVEKSFANSSEIKYRDTLEVYSDLYLDSLLLPSPVELHPISIFTESSLTLVWNAAVSNGFREYKLFRNTTSGLDENTGTLIHVSTSVNDTTFTDNLLDRDQTYFYRVYVMNGYGKMGGSNIVSGRIEESAYPSLLSYTLIKTKSIGVPYANPVGIASDNENVWIMFGDHNSKNHKLIYYNTDTYAILLSYDFYNLIEQLGTGVYGITWDGESVWISVSGNTNKLVKVNPELGTVIQTWSSPSDLGPSDLAWDGSLLWLSSGTGEIYTINPLHGGSDLFLSLSDDGNYCRDRGIAIRENEVWVGDLFSLDVHVYDKESGDHLGYLKNALTRNGNFCFHREQLAVLDESGINFYSIESR